MLARGHYSGIEKTEKMRKLLEFAEKHDFSSLIESGL